MSISSRARERNLNSISHEKRTVLMTPVHPILIQTSSTSSHLSFSISAEYETDIACLATSHSPGHEFPSMKTNVWVSATAERCHPAVSTQDCQPSPKTLPSQNPFVFPHFQNCDIHTHTRSSQNYDNQTHACSTYSSSLTLGHLNQYFHELQEQRKMH
jgi:hypothetical protein